MKLTTALSLEAEVEMQKVTMAALDLAWDQTMADNERLRDALGDAVLFLKLYGGGDAVANFVLNRAVSALAHLKESKI
jgi:hypothetical protein